MKLKQALFSGVLTVATLSPTHAQTQNALSLDGNNDIVQTTFPGISGGAARTIEAWINTTVNSIGNQQVITDWGTIGTGTRYTFCLLANNAIRLEIQGYGLSGTTAVNDGNWHHVAVTYDPAANPMITLYVDGVVDATGNPSVSVNSGTTLNMRIGQRIDGAKNFTGNIDEIRVWDIARSQSEIQAGMNSEMCSLNANLVAYYQFNEGTAGGTNTGITNAPDVSGNGNDGTLAGFSLTGATSNWITGAPLSAGFSTGVDVVSACPGYMWLDGNTYNANNNTAIHTLVGGAANGCDSIVRLDFTTLNNTGTATVTACDSYTWIDGNTYTNSNNSATHTLTNLDGCDSVVTLNLTITNSNTGTEVVTACDSYTWQDGNTYTSDNNTATHNLTNMDGCDSLVTLDLTMHYSNSGSETVNQCGGLYVWPATGLAYQGSGTFTTTITNMYGCDSVATLYITIDEVDTAVSKSVHGVFSSADAMASHQWLDCDNGFAVVAGATQQDFTPVANGSYAVEVTMGTCVDTSACLSITNVGLMELDQSAMKLYPNPSNGSFQISGAMAGNIEIMDLSGRSVMTFTISANQEQSVDMTQEPKGVYLVRLITEKEITTQRLILD